MSRIESFRNAFRGARIVFTTQPNARIHVAFLAVVVGAGVLLDVGGWDWCWLVTAITMVVVTEVINTAIEILGDAVSEGKYDPRVGRAKDVAAAAVLLAAMGAVVIGVIIFVPHLLDVVVGETGR